MFHPGCEVTPCFLYCALDCKGGSADRISGHSTSSDPLLRGRRLTVVGQQHEDDDWRCTKGLVASLGCRLHGLSREAVAAIMPHNGGYSLWVWRPQAHLSQLAHEVADESLVKLTGYLLYLPIGA